MEYSLLFPTVKKIIKIDQKTRELQSK